MPVFWSRHALKTFQLQREADGRKYIEFEFASKASTYIRHALASVTVANGMLCVMLHFVAFFSDLLAA